MKNLLITTFGEYNHLEHWLNGELNFDVALINYDYHEHPCNLIGKCVYLDSFHTFKYPGIAEAFLDEPTLKDYDYFFMPDEDVDILLGDINKLFDKARTLNLDLCCPSFERSDRSFVRLDMYVNNPTIDIQPVNFIEAGTPLFSKKALEVCLPTFSMSQSGWGLDIVWPKLIGDNGSNIAVVHSIVAKHTRSVRGGNLYEALEKKRISAYREKRNLMEKYQVFNFEPKIHA